MLRWRNLKIAGYFMAGFQSKILDYGSYDVNSYTGFPTSGQPSFCCAPGDQRQLELSVHCLIGTGTARQLDPALDQALGHADAVAVSGESLTEVRGF